MGNISLATVIVALLGIFAFALAIHLIQADIKCHKAGYPTGSMTLTLEQYCIGEFEQWRKDFHHKNKKITYLKDIQQND